MAKFWAFIELLKQLVEAAAVFIGFIEKKKHEHNQDEIAKDTGKVGTPGTPEEDRREATEDLEDRLNRRT